MATLATGLTTDHETKAGAHPISGVTGLQAALDGKAVSNHTHSINNVTGLQAALDNKYSPENPPPSSGGGGGSLAVSGTDANGDEVAVPVATAMAFADKDLTVTAQGAAVSVDLRRTVGSSIGELRAELGLSVDHNNQWPVFEDFESETPTLPLIAGGWERYDTGYDVAKRSVVIASPEIVEDGGVYTLALKDYVFNSDSVLSFDLAMISELNYDFLSWSLDGVQIGKKSGSVKWTNYTINVPAGVHSIEWVYSKDSSGAVGDDRAYIDNVKLTSNSTELHTFSFDEFTTTTWGAFDLAEGDSDFVASGFAMRTCREYEYIEHDENGLEVGVHTMHFTSYYHRPAILSFKASAYANYSGCKLTCMVDDAIVMSLNVYNVMNWEKYKINVPVGVHTVTWKLTSSTSISSWAMVDEVEVTDTIASENFEVASEALREDFANENLSIPMSLTNISLEPSGDASAGTVARYYASSRDYGNLRIYKYFTRDTLVEFKIRTTEQAFSVDVFAGEDVWLQYREPLPEWTWIKAVVPRGINYFNIRLGTVSAYNNNGYAEIAEVRMVDSHSFAGLLTTESWSRVDSGDPDHGFVMASPEVPGDDNSYVLTLKDYDFPFACELSFDARVSSESGYDLLKWELDGTLVQEISGELDWAEYSINVPAGVHTVAWTYYKGGSDDRAYIDNIELKLLGGESKTKKLCDRVADLENQLGGDTTIADVTGLQDALDGKAALEHAHTIADVTGLQDALDKYSPTNKPTAADIQNVVSSVSLGGIIERGSNANGEYVKFADGTLICTLFTANSISTTAPSPGDVIASTSRFLEGWTFPSMFLTGSVPAVYATGTDTHGSGIFVVSVTNDANTQLLYFTNTAVMSNLGTAFSRAAIGRWK